MTEFTQNAYVFLWGALAVLMYFAGRKYSSFGYLFSLLFTFMTVWYGLRSFAGLPMFEGLPGIIYRCVLGMFLAVLAGGYIVKKLRSGGDSTESAS